MKSLTSKSIIGFKWNLFQTLSIQGVNFIVSILLARLLTPDDFGTVGIIMIFITIGQNLVNGGLSQSVLRLAKPTSIDYNTLFFLNLVLSVFIYMILFFSSPFIALYFEKPILDLLLKMSGITLLISAFSIVQSTRLNRDLNFRRQFFINLPGTMFSAIVGILCALHGMGVYALVYMQLCLALVSTLLLWKNTNWYPKLSFNRKNILSHLAFGVPVTLSGLITNILRQVNTFFIGKFFNMALLGYYSRALSLKDLPINILNNLVEKLSLPIFAELGGDKEKIVKFYQLVFQSVILLLGSLLVFLIINAKEFITFLIGEKWLPSVLMFQILCVGGGFQFLLLFNLNLLKLAGETKKILLIEILGGMISLISLIFGYYFGIYVLVSFSVIYIVLNNALAMFYALKFLGLKVKSLIKNSLKEVTFFLILIVLLLLVNYVQGLIFSHFYLIAKLFISFGFTAGLLFGMHSRSSFDSLVFLKMKVLKKS